MLCSVAVARMLVRSGTLVLAAALGIIAGCPFDRGFSCGDGWWDPEYEECDPRDITQPYLDACRDKGFAKDAECDPNTCMIRASEADCNECGDGVAGPGEQCDGQDLRGQTCNGTLACSDQCQYDYSACEEDCGDGVVLGGEECEIGVDPGFSKSLACTDYATSTVVGPGFDKPYASGTIGACSADTCKFGRNDCTFCGDGQLDREYTDVIAPSGTDNFPEELCDGAEVHPDLLEEHCEGLCGDPPPGDVTLNCDFQCADDCLGIEPISDIIPPQTPEALGCCIAKGSPCPMYEAVPDLPCCSWLDNPDWLAMEKCVPENSNQVPITYICP